MDDLIAILLEVFFETADSVAENKRSPRWLRIIAGAVIFLFVVGTSALLIVSGIGSKNFFLTAFGIVVIVGFIGYIIYRINVIKKL